MTPLHLQLQAPHQAEQSCSPLTNRANCRPAKLALRCAAALIPHPEKMRTGGEDAYFISNDQLKFGAHHYDAWNVIRQVHQVLHVSRAGWTRDLESCAVAKGMRSADMLASL